MGGNKDTSNISSGPDAHTSKETSEETGSNTGLKTDLGDNVDISSQIVKESEKSPDPEAIKVDGADIIDSISVEDDTGLDESAKTSQTQGESGTFDTEIEKENTDSYSSDTSNASSELESKEENDDLIDSTTKDNDPSNASVDSE